MSNQLKKLEENRKAILFLELAGLLHDIGKLSEDFLTYRETWQRDSKGEGYWNDPHEHNYLDNEGNEFRKLIPEEFTKVTIGSINASCFGEADFSIRKAIHDHHKKDEEIDESSLITKMLKAADGNDSAIDRNNPLFSAEQKDQIYRSSVFGFEEGRVVTAKSQEEARKKLYEALRGELLKQYLDRFDSKSRQRLLEEIEKAFEQGVADTTRPQNDSSLWEHAYAVASILKVLTVHNLFNQNKIYKLRDVRFGIFGIGWDGLRFMSYGQKIGDIVGKKNLIDEIKLSIKEIIESKYPIGNFIYEDDDGIYFIVPAHFNGAIYEDIRTQVIEEIYKTAASKSACELQPSMVDIPDTDTLTSIVRAIDEMGRKTAYRFHGGAEGFEGYKNILNGFESDKTICPICCLRPVEREDTEKKLCRECKERRIRSADKQQRKNDRQTVFIDEIVDENQGAALVVARFGLTRWLDGTMIRTLFITEENGIKKEIESLGTITSFKDEKKLQDYFKESGSDYSYKRIKEDIDSFFSTDPSSEERAKNTAFLYYHDRKNLGDPNKAVVEKISGYWNDLLKSTSKEIRGSNKKDISLYNILTAKSPTPSTVLDVWTTTRHFFEQEISGGILKEACQQLKRLRIITEEDIQPWGKGTMEAELIYKAGTRKNAEVLCKGNKTLEVVGIIHTLDSAEARDLAGVNIIDENYRAVVRTFTVKGCLEGDSFLPYRVVTESPYIYMAIVPADKALEITNAIYKKYNEQFGKVMGRLPFSIGNIFFRSKMPMFVVLDTGKKMIANFRKLAQQKVTFDVEENGGIDKSTDRVSCSVTTALNGDGGAYKRNICWNLPRKLGNGEEDYHHPYFIVDSGNDDITDRPSSFKTIAGGVVHFTNIQKGDTLCFDPNYYDFEFLDSNIRRHKVGIDADSRRKSNIANFRSKPFLLDELDQKIMHVWERLIQDKQLSGMTDTKLKNLQSLWLTKYQEWEVSLDKPTTDNYRCWLEFIETSIQKEFPDITGPDQNVLLETIKNGVFFDTLELCLSILKLKVSLNRESKT